MKRFVSEAVRSRKTDASKSEGVDEALRELGGRGTGTVKFSVLYGGRGKRNTVNFAFSARKKRKV